MNPNLKTIHEDFVELKEVLRKHSLTQGVFDLLDKVDKNIEGCVKNLQQLKAQWNDPTTPILEYYKGRLDQIDEVLGVTTNE